MLEAKKEDANANSIATAKLGSLVYSALGSKGAKAKLDDFLPYEISKVDNGLKESTIAAMKWALKHQKMPPAIIGLIGAELG